MQQVQSYEQGADLKRQYSTTSTMSSTNSHLSPSMKTVPAFYNNFSSYQNAQKHSFQSNNNMHFPAQFHISQTETTITPPQTPSLLSQSGDQNPSTLNSFLKANTAHHLLHLRTSNSAAFGVSSQDMNALTSPQSEIPRVLQLQQQHQQPSYNNATYNNFAINSMSGPSFFDEAQYFYAADHSAAVNLGGSSGSPMMPSNPGQYSALGLSNVSSTTFPAFHSFLPHQNQAHHPQQFYQHQQSMHQQSSFFESHQTQNTSPISNQFVIPSNNDMSASSSSPIMKLTSPADTPSAVPQVENSSVSNITNGASVLSPLQYIPQLNTSIPIGSPVSALSPNQSHNLNSFMSVTLEEIEGTNSKSVSPISEEYSFQFPVYQSVIPSNVSSSPTVSTRKATNSRKRRTAASQASPHNDSENDSDGSEFSPTSSRSVKTEVKKKRSRSKKYVSDETVQCDVCGKHVKGDATFEQHK
jgi:hypothetical protein